MKRGIPYWQDTLRATRPKEGIPIPSILPRLRFAVKEKLCNHLRRCRQAGVRIRYRIVINLLNGCSAARSSRQRCVGGGAASVCTFCHLPVPTTKRLSGCGRIGMLTSRATYLPHHDGVNA